MVKAFLLRDCGGLHIRVAGEEIQDHPLVLLERERAGRIDHPSAFLQHRVARFQKGSLDAGAAADLLFAPFPFRLGVLPEHEGAGAGGVQQDPIEGFQEAGISLGEVLIGDDDVPQAHPFDVGGEVFGAGGADVVAEQNPASFHQKGSEDALPSGGSA